MRSEQEMLASLISSGEEKEVLNTGDLMFSTLKSKMGPPNAKFLDEVTQESSYEMYKDVKGGINSNVVTGEAIQSFSANNNNNKKSVTAKKNTPAPNNVSSEKLLKHLYSIYDNLILTFEKTGMEFSCHEQIISSINHTVHSLRHLGVEMESFDPYNHVSGLDVPDFCKNVNKVIEQTVQCYKKGKIFETSVSEDYKTINITFSGETSDRIYVACGRITCDNWKGVEAIDYIYGDDGGKMSVKVFENGKWVDYTSKGNYDIVYELEEADKNNITSDNTDNNDDNDNDKNNITSDGKDNNDNYNKQLENNKDNIMNYNVNKADDIIENQIDEKYEEVSGNIKGVEQEEDMTEYSEEYLLKMMMEEDDKYGFKKNENKEKEVSIKNKNNKNNEQTIEKFEDEEL